MRHRLVSLLRPLLSTTLTDDCSSVALVSARAVSALAVAVAKVVYTPLETCCTILVRLPFVSARPGTITLKSCFCGVNHEHEDESMGFTVKPAIVPAPLKSLTHIVRVNATSASAHVSWALMPLSSVHL